MASSLSEFQQALCLRMNTASVKFVGNTPWCSLCYRELPFKSQYDGHTFGNLHLKNTNSVFKILVDKYLSRGILLEDDGIYCMLCEERISHRFDWRFRQHIVDDYSHRNKMRVQSEYNHFDTFYENLFDLSQDADSFVAKVSRAGILMDTTVGEMRCFPCGSTLPGRSQFNSHITGASHERHVKDQLMNLADFAGLVLGIVIKDGCYSCDLCDIKIGSVTSSSIADEVYDHIRPSNGFQTLHAQREKQQLDYGLDNYYDTDESDSGDDYEDSSHYSSSSDDYSD